MSGDTTARAGRIARRRLARPAAVWVLLMLVACQTPIEPPGPLRIGDDGVVMARQVVRALKSLRTVYDADEVRSVFDFSETLIDSLWMTRGQWGPADVESFLARGLSKAADGAAALVPARVVSALEAGAGSVGRSMAFPHALDTAQLDSLRQIDSEALRLWIPLDSVASPWDSAGDSVFGTWVYSAADGAWQVRLDSLKRLRAGDSSGARLSDTEKWAPGAGDQWALATKRQVLVDGVDTVYAHRAQLSGAVIADDIVLDRDTAVLTVGMRRSDTSSVWWNRADSSLLLFYSDSLAHPGGAWERTTLLDSTYSFPRSDETQTLALRRTWAPGANGDLDSSVLVFVERVPGGVSETQLQSYGRSDYYRDRTIARYELRGLADTIPLCSLRVSVSSSVRPLTVFGMHDSMHVALSLDTVDDWENVRYTGLRRRDFFDSTSRGGLGSGLDYVEWDYRPQGGVAALGALSARPAGSTTVTAWYATSPRTVTRQWTLRDSLGLDVDSVSYTWAGVYNDSVHVVMELRRATGERSYRYTNPWWLVRCGSIRPTTGGVTLSDTMWSNLGAGAMPRVLRTIDGDLDNNGYGTLNIGGIDTFALALTGDSIEVTGSAEALPCGGSVVWAANDSMWVASCIDDGSSSVNTFEIRLGEEGLLEGTFSRKAAVGGTLLSLADPISVSPVYRGSANLFGIFENYEEGNFDDLLSVYATLTISLWGTNSLSGGESFE